MKSAVIVATILLLHAAPAFAQTKPAPKPDPLAKAAPAKSEPAKSAKPCDEYGAGFVRMGETGTCVKFGGYVRIQGSAR